MLPHHQWKLPNVPGLWSMHHFPGLIFTCIFCCYKAYSRGMQGPVSSPASDVRVVLGPSLTSQHAPQNGASLGAGGGLSGQSS